VNGVYYVKLNFFIENNLRSWSSVGEFGESFGTKIPCKTLNPKRTGRKYKRAIEDVKKLWQ
jgi:hypothetical protein